MGSPSFKVNVDDLKRVGKDAALVGVSAALSYVGTHLASVDFGVYGPFLIPALTTAISFGVKWAKDNTSKE